MLRHTLVNAFSNLELASASYSILRINISPCLAIKSSNKPVPKIANSKSSRGLDKIIYITPSGVIILLIKSSISTAELKY
jgi:hypothetical protein